jgi:outer membrane receptor protein involved in Fe transport
MSAMPTKGRTFASFAFATCSLAVSGAWAQTAQESSTTAKPTEQLESVVVTAQKRKEDVRKVPLAISVVSGADLESQHIVDVTDLTRAVPNLSFSGGQAGAGAGLSNLQMRGISSVAGAGTVGLYLDDVSMSTRNLYSQGSAEPKFFDIERIEVLRGPQGTLYGASSMGGTIKFISNQPNLDAREINVSSEVSTTQHGGTNYTASVVLNAPVIPGQLAVRMGAQGGKTSGYVDLVSPTTGKVVQSGINSEHDEVFKLAAKWQPDARLTITPAFFYQKVRTDDMDVSYLNLPANQTNKTTREPGVDTLFVPSLTASYDFGNVEVTSVTSEYKRDFLRTQDGAAANSMYIGSLVDPSAPAGLGDAVSALPSSIFLVNHVKQVSEELRVASKAYDGTGVPIVWLAGAYIANLKVDVLDNEPVWGINSTFASYGTSAGDPAVLAGAYPNDFVGDNAYFSARHYTGHQYAGFGEATYYFSPALRFTAGARYLKGDETLNRDGDFYFAGGPVHSSLSSSITAVTPKFAVSLDLDPKNTVFASVNKGVRQGGANRALPSSCDADLAALGLGSPKSFNSDSLWNYEIGNKSRWLDNRLSFNASVFFIRWNNIQQDIALGCTFDVETNMGKAESRGVELEMKARVTPTTNLSLSGGYTKAEFSEDIPAQGIAKGDLILGVPKFNAAITIEQRFPITGEIGGVARFASRWVGSSRGALTSGDPDRDRPAYNISDASVGASLGDWEVNLFAKNIGNNNKVVQRPYVQYLSEGYRLRPMTIGLGVSAKL